MKIRQGILNDQFLEVISLESKKEFKEGARLFGPLKNNKGILFDFGYKSILGFENLEVGENIKVLLFEELISGIGTVQEILDLKANSNSIKYSTLTHSVALEVSEEFFEQSQIEIGTLFTLV